MKVLVQDRDTKHFFREDGTWTANRDDAKVFDHSTTALKECQEHKIKCDIVLAFLDKHYDVTLQCSES